MDREACWDTDHGVTKSWRRISMHAYRNGLGSPCVTLQRQTSVEWLLRRVWTLYLLYFQVIR